MKKKGLGYKSVARYAFVLLSFVLFSSLDRSFTPFSLALLVGNLYVGLNPIVLLTLYIASFTVSFSVRTLLCESMGGIFFTAVFCIMKRGGKHPSASLSIFSIIALLPYILMETCYDYTLRVVLAAAIVLLSFVMIPAVKVWLVKGLKYKLSVDEIVSAALAYALFGYGSIMLAGELPWKCVSVFLILSASSLGLNGFVAVVGFVSAIPLAAAEFSFVPIAIYCAFAVIAITFTGFSRLLSATLVATAEASLYLLTSVYHDRQISSMVYILVPIVSYLFLPGSLFKSAKETLKLYRANNLGRYSVNRNRSSLAGKLYEISAVFDEMTNSLEKLGESTTSENSLIERMTDGLLLSVCGNCPCLNKCRNRSFPERDDLKKVLTVGIAKRKVNLVDFPKEFPDTCRYTESLVFECNKLIREYEQNVARASAMESGKELIAAQAQGLSEVLKNLAFSFSRNLEVRGDLESKLSDNLYACGIYTSEILVFGEGNDAEINIVANPDCTDNPLFLRAIEEVTNYPVAITSRSNLSEKLSALSLKRAPAFDAAFGLAQTTKADKTKSGDTHSVTKISEGKFLVALNDGMGSGKKAEDISSTAISLIETFYKAGLSSPVVLSTVNKILTFDREDNFTALDVGIVDLFTGQADFIKIGSPYSYVLSKDTVKVIEGSSLPLGILDEMKPSVCKTALNSGDVIVFLSDGISDAFGSSSDIIDFLSAEKALNPKAIADSILNRALYENGGIAKDDMTAFCVRLFKRAV